jgi:threonine dehydrogenase-like Zn-dependent dehydrogenase
MSQPLPQSQFAVQLVGPGELRLNPAKPVVAPGPRQILCRVEAVGLCFSDMKLLQQFSLHGRKGRVVSGIEPSVLDGIPSYVPDDSPTVPGHEAVVRVCAVGDAVERYREGERYLVQTDYRWLPTTGGSNAAFGYNFEGALQEYVLMDERVITDPEGESLLIPAPENLGSSAVALVEPWACVEDAYATRERTQSAPGGKMLVVLEAGRKPDKVGDLLQPRALPREITLVGRDEDASAWAERSPVPAKTTTSLKSLGDAVFDDVVYFGANPDVIEALEHFLAPHGLLNLVLGGERIGRKVAVHVGRAHYVGTRIVGTKTNDPSDSIRHVPRTGEIRPGERIHIVGAAGPMGTMHVIRDLCQGVRPTRRRMRLFAGRKGGVTVIASDLDEKRLQALADRAARLAEQHGTQFIAHNPQASNGPGQCTYTVVMVPVPNLVSAAIDASAERGIINVFAGIPLDVTAEVDLDRYVEKRLYMTGTSGSVIEDMRTVLRKLESGALNTNISVAAVSGMKGAISGLEAVATRQIAGKIIVYPQLHELGLLTLPELEERFPAVFAELDDETWTEAAEKELLRLASA